jgi:hypothetical protein
MDKVIRLSQIGLYNPQRQNSEVTEKLFVVRQKQFELLMERLSREKKDSIAQHHLIIARRGMGKTTMLKRIEVELHKKAYKHSFIPLLLPEEQYNLKDLAEFWLNCLDVLADTLEIEKYDTKKIERVDNKIKELMSLKEPEKISEKAYGFLMDFCLSLKRRPVLLIDNIGLIFSRLNKHEHHVLRSCLSENGAPVIVGANVMVIEDVIDYNAPFYDFFQMHYLKKLNLEEFMDLLKNLAIVTQSDKEIFPLTQKQTQRLKALYQLTGGNPRVAVMLFRLIAKGFSTEINDDLEALLDETTPLYKARFEELSTQMQVILDAIALHWDPINLKQLSQATRYANNQLSPQLKRLIEEGWLETTSAYKAKGNAYFISERFFNIWILIRRSSRRQKKEIYCLSKFLESFYGDDIRESITLNEKDYSVWMDGFWINETLSALRKRNEGIAKEHLSKALDFIQNELPKYTQDDWICFAAGVIRLGYGNWLLNALAERGYDIVLAPYHIAIQALVIENTDNEKEAEVYLKNRAVEMGEPARMIIKYIKRYL